MTDSYWFGCLSHSLTCHVIYKMAPSVIYSVVMNMKLGSTCTLWGNSYTFAYFGLIILKTIKLGKSVLNVKLLFYLSL